MVKKSKFSCKLYKIELNLILIEDRYVQENDTEISFQQKQGFP